MRQTMECTTSLFHAWQCHSSQRFPSLLLCALLVCLLSEFFDRSPHNVPRTTLKNCIIYNNNNNSSNFTGWFSVPIVSFVRCAYRISGICESCDWWWWAKRSGKEEGKIETATMTATVAMVATAALTTHFMLRCISLYILFNNLTFFLTNTRKKEKRKSSYFVDAVSVLQKIQCQRQQSTITTTTASTK